ncbi:hypothetical protein A3860_23615 [Niastella vici]|uniref:Alpha-L-rhamnosidase six-hairpin glycosidase domain-containing protein n=1 Tax=Niastella vici TaxID=1703345 RepID=A0A1V9FZX1_9BACT|nr:hypothetical protein [Niastella vici]OQP63919.1 hypothetical protein A3860_23615 [Niastella vici]
MGRAKLLLALVSAGLASSFTNAQLPESVNKFLEPLNGIVQYNIETFSGTDLVSRRTFPGNQLNTGSAVWALNLVTKPVPGQPDAIDVTAGFTLQKGQATATAVSISIDFGQWSRTNYVMVPAVVYNGNRYRSIGNGYNPPYPKDMFYNPQAPLTISNNPRLSVEEGKPAVIELQTGNAATPAMCFLAATTKKGFILLTEQQTKFGNSGLTISENAAQDSSRFAVSAPAVRKLAPGFGDFHKSGDKAPDWNAGDAVSIHFRLYVFNAQNIPALLVKFNQVRKQVTGPNQPRNQLPMSKYLQLATTICSNNFVTVPVGSYYLPENNKDFQLGWVSGMMNSYPMLALNNETERKRVAAELDFVVAKLQGKSGYFYGGIKAEGELRGDKPNPYSVQLTAMVRKNSDALLWFMKHFLLFKEQGHQEMIKVEWEEAARRLAMAFVNTWKKYGEFGQYIEPETGEVAVFNSTAGAIAPAGLAIAADYFKQPAWLQVARDAANYYYNRDVVKQGLTGGDCGDISQDANSESAYGFLESLMAMYYYTGDKSWLQKAEVQAALCATWALSYDPVFPPNSEIGKLQCKMAGAVWASIQNKHAAPGICTASGDYLFRLYRATGNALYAELIRDIQHAHAEAVNRPPGHITTNNLPGSSMERIQPSDAEGKGSIGNFINTRNSWTETNGMLMALELPGIYVQTDKKKLVVFDHVEVRVIKSDNKQLTIEIKNPTAYDANVAVFAETGAQAQKPLPYTAFVQWPKVGVKAGETKLIGINTKGKVVIQ